MPLDLLMIVGGGLILYLGAEWLVKGSAGLARSFGVKPLVIGLTVIAYGTSAPELSVSASAILEGSSDIVLGNIIGSCIANLGLILGITALIAPPSVDGSLIRREIPILVVSAMTIPLVLGWDSAILWWEAFLMLTCAIAFTVWTLGSAKGDSNSGANNDEDLPSDNDDDSDDDSSSEDSANRLMLIGLTLVGLGALVGGGEIFVRGARSLALALGMSDRLVGLTVVAIGTSLPELAASVVAATRGMSGLAVGNVIGSNIFNIFLVLGAVGLFRPITGSIGTMHIDLMFLIGITILGVLAMRGDRRVSRVEGALLLATYVAFIFISVARNYGWM